MVIHEILHHMGLVDEYKEEKHLFGRCRALGPFDSIMRNCTSRVIEFSAVTCEMSSEYKNNLKNPNIVISTDGLYSELMRLYDVETGELLPISPNMPFFCKVDSIKIENKISFPYDGDIDFEDVILKGEKIYAPMPLSKTKIEFISDKLVFLEPVNYTPLRLADSRLYPAHIRSIIHPNCREKNPKYNFCAQYAYSTFECATDHPECQGEDWVK